MSFRFPWSSARTARTTFRLVVLAFVAAFIGMSGVNAATIDSGVKNVSNDGAQSIWPKVAQSRNGDVHVVWDNTENGHTIKYAKGTWNGSTYTFGAPQNVGPGHPTGFALPAVAVAPNGQIMVAWSNQNKAISYRIWNSADATPGGTITVLEAGIQPSIATDSESDFHLAWSGNFDVRFREINSSGAIIAATIFGQNVNSPPDIAVDSNNNDHVVWMQQGQVVQYAARAANAATFGAATNIAGGTAPQIAADGQGNVHIVRSQNNDIVYCRKTFTTACQDLRTLDAASDLQPTIGATRVGSVLIAFRAAGTIWYDAFENGVWQTTREIPGGGGGVQIDVASRPCSPRVPIVWDKDFDIQFSFARTTPVFDTGTNEMAAAAAPVVSHAATKVYLPFVSKQPIVTPPLLQC